MENKRVWLSVLFIVVTFSIVAMAHEGGKHFLGTVEAFDDQSLTVITANSGTLRFAITKETKFSKVRFGPTKKE